MQHLVRSLKVTECADGVTWTDPGMSSLGTAASVVPHEATQDAKASAARYERGRTPSEFKLAAVREIG